MTDGHDVVSAIETQGLAGGLVRFPLWHHKTLRRSLRGSFPISRGSQSDQSCCCVALLMENLHNGTYKEWKVDNIKLQHLERTENRFRSLISDLLCQFVAVLSRIFHATLHFFNLWLYFLVTLPSLVSSTPFVQGKPVLLCAQCWKSTQQLLWCSPL